MEFQELKQKPEGELRELLQNNRERLRQLKFDLASGKVKNIREIREIKKDIARILTRLRQEASTSAKATADKSAGKHAK